MDLNNARVVVMVFGTPGCPACAEYVPRFNRIAARYAHCLPIYVVDGNADEFDALTNRLGVVAFPTTVVMRRPRGLIKVEGGVSDAQIEAILQRAVRGLTCELDR